MSASPGSMEREPTPDAVAKLATLVRIATVSHRDPARNDTAAFDLFLTELARLSRCCTPSSSSPASTPTACSSGGRGPPTRVRWC